MLRYIYVASILRRNEGPVIEAKVGQLIGLSRMT